MGGATGEGEELPGGMGGLSGEWEELRVELPGKGVEMPSLNCQGEYGVAAGGEGVCSCSLWYPHCQETHPMPQYHDIMCVNLFRAPPLGTPI